MFDEKWYTQNKRNHGQMMVCLRKINAEVWDQFPLSSDQTLLFIVLRSWYACVENSGATQIAYLCLLFFFVCKATFNSPHQIIWKRCYDPNSRCWVLESSVLNWDYSLLFDTLRHYQGRYAVMCGWGHLTSDHVLFENFMLPPIMFDALFFNPCMNSRNFVCVGCSPH